jgi:hypothetical protein
MTIEKWFRFFLVKSYLGEFLQAHVQFHCHKCLQLLHCHIIPLRTSTCIRLHLSILFLTGQFLLCIPICLCTYSAQSVTGSE